MFGRMLKSPFGKRNGKMSLPSSENRVGTGSTFRITSVLVSHLAYTSCRRVDNTSTILLGLKLIINKDKTEFCRKVSKTID